RYVSEGRLYKMLDHEYELIRERLMETREDAQYFVFADTVSAINYARTIKGNGWMGVRFQHQDGSPPSDIVMHVKMLDKNNRQQQEAIGVLGVNLIYACYYYRDDLETFIVSLIDGLKSRIQVDLLRTTGDAFAHFDDRLSCLYLVKHDLTEVAMFDHNKVSRHPSEFLYRKDLMVVRGHFRPPTLVTMDALNKSFDQFKNEPNSDPDSCRLVAEITMDNLQRFGPLDTKDFLDRTEILCALGLTVIISDCTDYFTLINYLSDHKIQRLGIVIGVHELAAIIKEKYEEHHEGRLLTAFGELFSSGITVYAYPALEREGDAILKVEDMPVPEGMKFLYQHIIQSGHITNVNNPNEDNLHIIPYKVFDAITSGSKGWEECLPEMLPSLIKSKRIFGYEKDTIEA
ncbi:MAG: TonB-dependent receptor, partial [Bacteroidota bacterium]